MRKDVPGGRKFKEAVNLMQMFKSFDPIILPWYLCYVNNLKYGKGFMH
jgi:hypothetical protein